MTDSEVSHNKTLSEAGGILSKTELIINESQILENKTKKQGGGILNDIDARAIIINTKIIDNLSKDLGGGIFNRNKMELLSDIIKHNGAKKTGGGVYSEKMFTEINSQIIENYPNNVIVV